MQPVANRPVTGTFLDNLSATAGSGDIEALIMSLAAQRSNLLDQVTQGAVQDMQARNAYISKLNSALQELRANGPKDKDGTEMKAPLSQTTIDTLKGVKLSDGKSLYEAFINEAKYTNTQSTTAAAYNANPSAFKLIDANGQVTTDKTKAQLTSAPFPITYRTVAATAVPNSQSFKAAGDFEKITENLKTEVDKQSSNSQLEMIQLQGLINKRNQMVEMITNLMEKFTQLGEKIIGNMR